jgi:hypothetical protein
MSKPMVASGLNMDQATLNCYNMIVSALEKLGKIVYRHHSLDLKPFSRIFNRKITILLSITYKPFTLDDHQNDCLRFHLGLFTIRFEDELYLMINKTNLRATLCEKLSMAGINNYFNQQAMAHSVERSLFDQIYDHSFMANYPHLKRRFSIRKLSASFKIVLDALANQTDDHEKIWGKIADKPDFLNEFAQTPLPSLKSTIDSYEPNGLDIY